MGGLLNFWKQHNPGNSNACQLALQKNNKLKAAQRSQPVLLSFFAKCPKDLVPPTVPILHHVIANVVEATSSAANVVEPTFSITNVAALSCIPDTLVNTLLADLEKVISNLPGDPDPTEMKKLSTFSHILPTTIECEDSWKFIVEPHLNCFLGFGKSLESIAASLKEQKKELVTLISFLRDYTRWFQIDGALLEGKV